MITDWINTILPTIAHFHMAGYWIAFFAALIETTIGIGLILPGSTIILLLGALSARGYFDVGDLVWFSVLGAILGDNLNYFLGRKYGSKWLKDGFWLLKAHHVEKTRQFMNVHGAKSIFIGRFIPTVKEIAPFIAGSVRMHQGTFMFWNVLGAIGWGCEWVFAGFIFAHSLSLAQVWLSRAGLLFAFFLIFITVFYGFRWLIVKIGKPFLTFLSSFWQPIKESIKENKHLILWAQKHPSILSFLKARSDPTRFSGQTLSISVLALAYLLALFGGVIEDLITYDPLIAADIRISNLFSVFRTDMLTRIFTWITLLGKSQVIVIFVFISMVWLWSKKDKYSILPLLMAVVGSSLFTFLGKLAFARPRPEMAIYAEHSFSFPSGHATIAIAFYGFIAFLLMQATQKWNTKVNLFFAAFFLIIMIGLSRIYLGVHYVSDVWSGYLAGTIWLVISICFFKWLRHKKTTPTPVIPGTRLLPTILMSMAIFFYIGFGLQYHPPLAVIQPDAPVATSKTMGVFATEQTRFTETIIGDRQEPINFIFIAKNDNDIIAAFTQAGWMLTDPADIFSFSRAVKALILKIPHPSAPISPCFWNTKIQDLGFAKTSESNWLKNAQHIIIWKTNHILNNTKTIYVGMMNVNDGFRWGMIPRILPDLDTGRELLFSDLIRTGKIQSHLKEQLVKPFMGKNFIGDPFFTDGKVYIITIKQ